MEFSVLFYLAAINLIAFALMGADKFRAKQNAWRIPEKTLFLAAAIGGSLGATLGMKVFHHKTKHWYFRYGFPLLLALHIIIAFFLLQQAGLL